MRAAKKETAAQTLGRAGGLKGGPARARKLGPKGRRRASLKAWRTRREVYGENGHAGQYKPGGGRRPKKK